jgi:type I restriction-modification system DNA methylase subunit
VKIDQETIETLARATISGSTVHLLDQMERPLYLKVNKVLEAAGGKWNRKLRCHVFEEDPIEVLEQAVLTGSILEPKQELGVFYTPPALAQRAAQALRLDHTGITVLEPSCGMGALAIAAKEQAEADPESSSWADIQCMDILEKHVAAAHKAGFKAWQGDFLREDPQLVGLFDRIIMNPPFARSADAQHFIHAMGFLEPGGRLVAIMSAGVTFRETTLYRLIRQNATSIEALPAGSFKEAGTGVNTALVIYDKPKT